MSNQILIFSSSIDKPTTDPVTTSLQHRGYTVINYEADKVASGEASLAITVNGDGTHIRYNGEPLHLNKIVAAWYRRPNLFGPVALGADRAARSSIDLERRASAQLIEDEIPTNRWLNSPGVLKHQEADHKLSQLSLARKVGFRIPRTVVSNEWPTIGSTLGPNIVYKTFWGQRMATDRRFMLFTTPLMNTGPDHPPMKGLPFPGIWQENLPKKREWRITVIGNRTFDAIVNHDTEKTKDDWRRYALTQDITWKSGKFPDSEKEKCFEYCKQANLRMGMFDFIEDAEEGMTFLECNPNGQYTWLENELHFPLSKTVADELILIAESNTKPSHS
jgi:hypothetical protein